MCAVVSRDSQTWLFENALKNRRVERQKGIAAFRATPLATHATQWAQGISALVATLSLPVFCITLLSYGGVYALGVRSSEMHWHFIWLLSLFIFVGFTSWFLFITLDARTIRKPKWERVLLDGYGWGNLPRSVLGVAQEAKREVPDCKLCVDELRMEDRILDPYLLAIYKGRQYYLCYWDEPTVRRKRTLQGKRR